MKLYSLAVLVSVFLTYSSGDEESDFQACKALVCPMNWLPVCAVKDNVYTTFGNKCDLERVNCFTKPKHTYVGPGRCENLKKKKGKVDSSPREHATKKSIHQ